MQGWKRKAGMENGRQGWKREGRDGREQTTGIEEVRQG